MAIMAIEYMKILSGYWYLDGFFMKLWMSSTLLLLGSSSKISLSLFLSTQSSAFSDAETNPLAIRITNTISTYMVQLAGSDDMIFSF